jgi:hypothetical protein
MIANIANISSLSPLLKYNEDKVKEGKSVVFFVANSYMSSYQGALNSIADISKLSRRKDRIFHLSLNFTETDYDKLSVQETKGIFDKYMLRMGFPAHHFYISYLHSDTNNSHINVVANYTDENGKMLNTLHNRRVSQRITRSFEKESLVSN